MKTAILMLALVMALGLICSASAENYIEKWGGSGTQFDINQEARRITITGAGEYKFQATDGAGLGQINEITVQNGVTGNVTIYVERSTDDDSPGAANVLECNLSSITANTTIAELRITGNLGANGATVADNLAGPLVAYDILSAIELDILDGDITCNTMRDLTVSVEARAGNDITISGSYGAAYTMDLTGSQDTILIEGFLYGNIYMDGSLEVLDVGYFYGDVSVSRDLGRLTVDGSFDGQLEVERDLEWLHVGFDIDGVIKVGGDLLATHLTGGLGQDGMLMVNGDLYEVVIEEDLAGLFAVNGSLIDVLGDSREVEVYGEITSTGALAIDYDGYDSGDGWQSGAVVYLYNPVGATNALTGNSPAEHVYEITECVADMDNNGAVNFNDVDGFVAATVSLANYGALYPGLRGSALYHGDMDRSGVINFDDLDLFIDCVVAGGCPTSAGACGGDGKGGRSPAQMAAALAGGVAPERQALLAEIIADHATRQRTAADQAYWDAVWTALTD